MGRISERLIARAQHDEQLQHLVTPTGVEVLKEAAAAGAATESAVNCCNGRVARRFDSPDLLAVRNMLSRSRR